MRLIDEILAELDEFLKENKKYKMTFVINSLYYDVTITADIIDLAKNLNFPKSKIIEKVKHLIENFASEYPLQAEDLLEDGDTKETISYMGDLIPSGSISYNHLPWKFVIILTSSDYNEDRADWDITNYFITIEEYPEQVFSANMN